MLDIEQIENLFKEHKTLYSFTIELVNHCNWECKHCYLDKEKISIQTDKVFEIINEARKLGAYQLRLSGGEITIHKDLHEIIKYARKQYLSVVLLTNLSILKPNVYECIAEYGVERVEATMFSSQAEVHDAFVGVSGAFEKTLTNLRRLKELGVQITVKTGVIKSNFQELTEMQLFFENEGFRFKPYVQIYSDVHGTFKLPGNLRLTPKEFAEALKICDKCDNRVFPLDNPDQNNLCSEFLNSVYITSRGDVVPCAKFRKPIGSIYNTGLDTIWNGSEQLKRVQNYTWRDVEGCKDCKHKPYCVRCGAMAYIEGLNFTDNCDETCKLARIRSKNYNVGACFNGKSCIG